MMSLPTPSERRSYQANANTKRLCNLSQTLALAEVGVTLGRAACQLVENVGPGFRVYFVDKFVSQDFPIRYWKLNDRITYDRNLVAHLLWQRHPRGAIHENGYFEKAGVKK